MASSLVEIAGASVDLNELPALIRSQIKSPSIWFHRDDNTSFDGIIRAVREAGPYRPLFAEAIYELLVSPDLAERSAACYLLPYIRDDLGVTRLNAVLREYPAYYVGVAPDRRDLDIRDLEYAILESLVRMVKSTDKDAIYRLQDALYRFENAWLLWHGLARAIPDWVVDHAHRLPHDLAFGVAIHLPTAALRKRLFHHLTPWPQKILDDILLRRGAYSIATSPEIEDVRDLLKSIAVRE